MTRLVQIQNGLTRRVALVEEPHLRVLAGVESIYELAANLDAAGGSLAKISREWLLIRPLDYDEVYSGKSDWKLLPPIDHPTEPARCLVSGTGLTHFGSAANRQRMHEARESELTDSMKMFRWGVEGGKPAPGRIGVAPEWFYKGCGTILRAHGEPLEVPAFAEDGGEEAEIAGVYFVGENGTPRRIGMAIGNEFSDHQFEKKNYLNLAGSKLHACALGPELVIDPEFQSVPGKVTIGRGGRELWSKEIVTGEKEMCHSLANLEHHHFKYALFRQPGDVHVHMFGTATLSFADGIKTEPGDVFEIAESQLGLPLTNSVAWDKAETVKIKAL